MNPRFILALKELNLMLETAYLLITNTRRVIVSPARLIVLLLIISTVPARAASPPPIIFLVGTDTKCGGNLVNPPSWNCGENFAGNGYTGSWVSKGSTSATSISGEVGVSFTKPDTGNNPHYEASTPITIYVRRGTYTLTATHNVKLSIKGTKIRNIAYADYPFNQHLDLYEEGDKSDSSTQPVSGNCTDPQLRILTDFPEIGYCSVAFKVVASAHVNVNGSTAQSSAAFGISVDFTLITSRAGSGISGNPETIQCGDSTGSQGTIFRQNGGVQISSNDPIATRGWPLATRVFVNSQTKFPDLLTPIGLGGAFSYGIAVRMSADGVRYLIGEDGSEFSYGPAAGSPRPEPGVYAKLTQTLNGWLLSDAGPPTAIHRAGNFRYSFNAEGKLLSISDPSANIQQVAYDKAGNPIQVTDLNTGKNVRFEYGSNGLISRIVENGGIATRVLTYTNKRLINILLTGQNGIPVAETDITYDASGRPSTLVADKNLSTKIAWSYESPGNGTALANMSWGTGITAGSSGLDYFSLPVNGAAYRVTKTNNKGGKTNYDYDASGNLVRIELPVPFGATSAPVTTHAYDANRNVTGTSNGATSFALTYNALGNVTQVTSSANQTWKFSYLANGIDIKSAADSLGTLFTLSYSDPLNPHSPTQSTDGAGNTWSTEHNAYGQITKTIPPAGSPTQPTLYEYDETNNSTNLGYLNKITNGALDVVTIDDYSAQGDPISLSTTPRDGVMNTTRLERDADQRLTATIHPDGTTVRQSYKGRDLSQTVDENGEITTYDFCPSCGALEAVHAPLSKTLQTPHDADHDVSSFIDARGMKTSYVYGQSREQKETRFPDGTSLTNTYDSTGRLSTTTNGRKQQTKLTYDGAGRVGQIAFSNGQTPISFTYFPDNRVQTMKDETGTSTSTYTSNRLLESVTNDFSINGLTAKQTISYTYNPDSTLRSMSWASGETLVASWQFDRDKAGRIIAVTNTFEDRTEIGYDREGKIIRQTNSNGTELNYTFNEKRGWPTGINWKKGAETIASYGLSYDLGNDTVGNLTKVVEADGHEVSYGYDGLYRLTSEGRTGLPISTFEYDIAGNIQTKNGSLFATYDEANKIKTIAGGSATYDNDGNLTSAAPLGNATFSWDARNKLRSIGSTSYLYNGLGLRAVRAGTEKTFFIFSGTTLIGEITNGVPRVAYTWGPDGLVSERLLETNKSLFYHFGPQGETRQLSDITGLIVDTYTYNAYGEQRSTAAADPNPFRYAARFGYYADGDNYITMARWYSPILTRWLTRDPIGYRGGDNLYNYVDANPVTKSDPSGLQSNDQNQGFCSGNVNDENILNTVGLGSSCSGNCVFRCCRNVESGIGWADSATQALGLQHCWITTSSNSGGMGPITDGPLPTNPLGIPTMIRDHSQETGECTFVPGISESCIDSKISVCQGTGRWLPWNNCNTFANGLISACRIQQN